MVNPSITNGEIPLVSALQMSPSDSFHCWVILNLTSYCPPTPTQPLSSLETRANYAHTYTHTCPCTHTSCVTTGQGTPFSGFWGLDLDEGCSWVLSLTSPRILTVGKCRGQKQPLDRALAHLISPGPEAGKSQRRGEDPGGRVVVTVRAQAPHTPCTA